MKRDDDKSLTNTCVKNVCVTLISEKSDTRKENSCQTGSFKFAGVSNKKIKKNTSYEESLSYLQRISGFMILKVNNNSTPFIFSYIKWVFRTEQN